MLYELTYNVHLELVLLPSQTNLLTSSPLHTTQYKCWLFPKHFLLRLNTGHLYIHFLSFEILLFLGRMFWREEIADKSYLCLTFIQPWHLGFSLDLTSNRTRKSALTPKTARAFLPASSHAIILTPDISTYHTDLYLCITSQPINKAVVCPSVFI